jgi:hypothetical protein
MRAEQVTGPIAYHAEGPVWSERWGGLRCVDMLAGDVLSLSGDGMVGRRHVGRIVAALRPRLLGGAVLGVESRFALEAWASWTASPDPSATSPRRPVGIRDAKFRHGYPISSANQP